MHGAARRWPTPGARVATSSPPAPPGAAPFAAIVSNPAKGPPYIRTWLTRSHVEMPNFDLTRQDMADLVTYMQTLKR
jgi:mono/diheme cytochrome c family protein